MCMSLRIEPREMAEVLQKVRKMALAQEMSIKLGKSLFMSGVFVRCHLRCYDVVPHLFQTKPEHRVAL